MTDAIDELAEFRQFAKTDQERDDLANFECGDEPWSVKVSRFLTSGEPWPARKNGIKTWLYELIDADSFIIGYASESKKNLFVPMGDGRDAVYPTLHICWFGVRRAFQGRRASKRIHAVDMYRWLVERAVERDLVGITLSVDERNTGGIQFWERSKLRRTLWMEPYADDDGSKNIPYYWLFPGAEPTRFVEPNLAVE